MKLLKFDTDCNMYIVDISEYSKLRELLCGWPEHVRPKRLRQPYCMMVDDEGHMKKLPLNPIGSYLYETDKHGSAIVGDIYLMKEELRFGQLNFVGLSKEDLQILSKDMHSVVEKLKGVVL